MLQSSNEMPTERQEGTIQQFKAGAQHFPAGLWKLMETLSWYSRCGSKPGTFVRHLWLQSAFCVVKEYFSLLRW